MERDLQFAGLPVHPFHTKKPLPNPKTNAIFIGTMSYWEGEEYDDDESKLTFQELFSALLQQSSVSEIKSLVIGGWWGDEYSGDYDSGMVIQLLTQHAAQFPKLQALFIGNISSEEYEISWIQQSDIAPLYAAFPQLTTLKLRGGDGLSLGQIAHPNLTTLIIETGGLDQRIIQQLSQAQLPALTHLELWLGSEDYGNTCDPDALLALLQPELFPQLRYLGLRNAENIDLIVPLIVASPLIQRLQVLDFSLGNLSDEGAQALLTSPYLSHLKLDLHHHYLSTKLMKTLSQLLPEVNLEEQLEPDNDDGDIYRFIFASE